MHNGTPQDLEKKQPESDARVELINKALADISTMYKELKPTPEEEAIITLFLLRMMQEACADNRYSYPSRMSIVTPLGFRIGYHIEKPQRSPSEMLETLIKPKG